MEPRSARTLRRIVPGALALALAAIAPARAQHAPPPQPTSREAARPRIDMVFVLDATASMGDEIEPVKQHLWSIANRVAAGNPRPDLRVGLVVYRDRVDAEPSRVFPLTRDLDALHATLMRVEATGGGDEPEDVDTGLALGLREMNWEGSAAKMMFVVGDAPAVDYPDHDRRALIREAAERHIEVSTIECSGMGPAGHTQWAWMAESTHGLAQVLTYAQDQRLADGSSRTLMRQGAQTWIAHRALTPAEREEDASALAQRGILRAARPEEARGFGVEGMRPHRRAAGDGAAYAPAAPMSNNIATQITRRVQQRAAEMGVAY